jgi:phage FluMu protein Com
MVKCCDCNVVMIGIRFNQIKLECPKCGKIVINPLKQDQNALDKFSKFKQED